MAEQRTILPNDTSERVTLFAIMTIMCFLAAMALATASILLRSTAQWSTDLHGAVTVQIKPHGGLTRERQMSEALALLRGTPGIATARPLSDADIGALLKPWLGSNISLAELPVPQLIDVTIDRNAPPDLPALARRLSAKVPGALLDDHQSWNDQLNRFAARVSAGGIAVLLLIAGATMAIVAFATRADLRTNRETVEVLHLVGARADFIAGQFQRHFLAPALIAGLLGITAAIATLAALRLSMPVSGYFLPRLNVFLSDGLLLLFVPIFCAAVSVVTSRITVMNVLKKMP